MDLETKKFIGGTIKMDLETNNLCIYIYSIFD